MGAGTGPQGTQSRNHGLLGPYHCRSLPFQPPLCAHPTAATRTRRFCCSRSPLGRRRTTGSLDSHLRRSFLPGPSSRHASAQPAPLRPALSPAGRPARQSRSSIAFEPVLDDGEIRRLTQRFIETTGWHGQVGFDLRQNVAGQWIALECNPLSARGHPPRQGAERQPAHRLHPRSGMGRSAVGLSSVFFNGVSG